MPARRTAPTAADSSASLGPEIAELYALPLGEFTAARNALAGRLRKAGDGDGAAEVRALAKPTPAAWAVNQLLRRERAAFDALLAAGERARAALGRTLSGAGPEVVREALAEMRQRREQLLRRGADLLAGDGKAASAVQLERLAVDLEAMALSPAAQEAVERGWLDRDLDPPGFEVLAGLQLASQPARRPAPAPRAPEPPRAARPSRAQAPAAADRREEKAARERDEARLRERRARLQEKVDQRAQEAEELEVQAGTAEHESKVAESEARQAERAAAEARRRADQAREAAARARERAERAAGRLAQAQSDLAAAS